MEYTVIEFNGPNSQYRRDNVTDAELADIFDEHNIRDNIPLQPGSYAYGERRFWDTVIAVWATETV